MYILNSPGFLILMRNSASVHSTIQSISAHVDILDSFFSGTRILLIISFFEVAYVECGKFFEDMTSSFDNRQRISLENCCDGIVFEVTLDHHTYIFHVLTSTTIPEFDSEYSSTDTQ